MYLRANLRRQELLRLCTYAGHLLCPDAYKTHIILVLLRAYNSSGGCPATRHHKMGIVDGEPYITVQALGRLVFPLHTQIYGLHASLVGGNQDTFQQG